MRDLVLSSLVVLAISRCAPPAAQAEPDDTIPLVHPDWMQWFNGRACADAVTRQLADQCTTSAGFGPSYTPPTMENPENREFCSLACDKCCETLENPATGVLEFGCEALFEAAHGGSAGWIALEAFWTIGGQVLAEADPRLATVWHVMHALVELGHTAFEIDDLVRMRRELQEVEHATTVGEAVGEMVTRGAQQGWSQRSQDIWRALDAAFRSEQGRQAASYTWEVLVGCVSFVRLSLDFCGHVAEETTRSTCFAQCHARYPGRDGFPDRPRERDNPNDPTRNGTRANPWGDLPHLDPSRPPTRCRTVPGGLIQIDDDGDGDVDRTVSTDTMTCTVSGQPIEINPVPTGRTNPGTLPEPDDPGQVTSTNGRVSAPLPPGVEAPPRTGTFRLDPATGHWIPMPPARRIRVPRESGTGLGIVLNACADAGIDPNLCTTYVY